MPRLPAFPARSWRPIILVLAIALAQAARAQELDEAQRLVRAGAADRAIALLEPRVARLERARDTLALVRTLYLLGRARHDAGQGPAALHDLHRVLDLGGTIGAWKELGDACTLKAIIAHDISHPDTARQLYERAIAHYLQAHDTSACAIVYDNLGEFDLIAGNIPGAIRWSEKALACLKDTTWPDHHRTAALIESSLGNYHTWLGDRPRGIAHGLRSVQLARRSGEVYTIVHTNTQLAGAYLANGEVRKALPLLLHSDSLANAHAFPPLKHRDIPELLSSAYEQLGDHVRALHYYKQRTALNDSVRSNAIRREIERLERRQLQLADSLRYSGEMREQAARHGAEIATQRWITGSAVAVGLLVLAVALLLRDRNRRLQHANSTILSQQQQLVASEKAREAEELRTRIARDIHDEIGGELTKITLLGRKARRQLAGEPGGATESVDRIREISRRLGGMLSDIVWAVDPQRDTVQGLVDHARTVTRLLVEGAAVNAELRFAHDGPDHAIDPAVRRNLFLVLKEALNNALKHAGARTLHVVLETGAHRYRLLVKDDGLGFDAKKPCTGNGLRNIRIRAERLDSRITIISSPGQGTAIEMRGEFR